MKKGVILVLLLTVLFTASSVAQQNWGGGVDNETLHFGFKFQYVSAEYKILKRADWKEPLADPADGTLFIPSPLTSISSPVSQGFALGFVSDYKLTENANIRFTPGLVFSDVLANYEFADPSYNVQKKVQATFVDLPVSFKLKSNRQNNYRAYLIAGAKYSMDIVSRKKKDDSGFIGSEKFLKSVPNSLWYEAGVGLDIYFEWFKLSPEIKFAQTTKSVLLDRDRAENPYTSPIDKMFLRNFQFSLFFE